MTMNDQEFLVQKIRTQYVEKEMTRLDALKELDKKVKRPANRFAYTFGIIAAIIMGSGMSLVMTDIGEMLGISGDLSMIAGVGIGVVGLGLALLTFPMYKAILGSRRKKYADQIMKLSDEIMKGEGE